MKPLNLVRWALLTAATLALSCGLLAFFGSGELSQTQHASAKSRWAAQGIRHYRLAVMTGLSCRLEVEVRDEQVVAVLREDECGYPARTVSGLFTMIERAPSPLFTCASPSCACRNIITVYAIYEPQLGYPEKIAVRVDRETNWRKMSFWRYLWSARKLPNCDMASHADMVDVPLLTPLP